MSVSVKLNMSKLRRIISGEERAILAGLEDAARQVRDLAEQLAPVDTGYMRSHIVVEAGPRPGMYSVVAQAEYAVFVELGTRHMAAQPFLAPAFRRVDSLAIISRHLAELVR